MIARPGSALTRMALIAAALGVSLPMPERREREAPPETEADLEALSAAAAKRARKAARRLRDRIRA